MALQFILLLIFIVLSAFFSGSEVALLAISPVRVRTLRKEKRRGSAALARLKYKPRRMIITILIGNNVVNIAAASLVTVVTTDLFGAAWLGYSAGLLTLVILVFGEITPKTLANKYATPISLLIAKPVEFLYFILWPLVVFLDWLTGIIESGFKMKQHEPITENEIKTMVEYGVEHNVVAPEEQSIINRALLFADKRAQQIMIPLKHVFTLECTTTVEDALPQIIHSGYSRIPLYQHTADNIIGIVLIKDVARMLSEKRGSVILKEIMVPTTFIPEHMRIDYLFRIFKKTRKHIAMVYTKDKAVSGIVTLEDLIEELVGEIVDESDAVDIKNNANEKA